MKGGSQLKPLSISATRSVGKRSKTPSTIRLITWLWKTWAMPAYSSR